MPSGTVKYFNATKGYSFITPSDETKDVFVHVSALKKSNIMDINEGQRISYQIVLERDKEVATDIKLL